MGFPSASNLLQSYRRCQKNVPIAERFFATTLMPPSFFRNILMTSAIISMPQDDLQPKGGSRLPHPAFEPQEVGARLEGGDDLPPAQQAN
jgi:hypothetical protein